MLKRGFVFWGLAWLLGGIFGSGTLWALEIEHSPEVAFEYLNEVSDQKTPPSFTTGFYWTSRFKQNELVGRIKLVHKNVWSNLWRTDTGHAWRYGEMPQGRTGRWYGSLAVTEALAAWHISDTTRFVIGREELTLGNGKHVSADSGADFLPRAFDGMSLSTSPWDGMWLTAFYYVRDSKPKGRRHLAHYRHHHRHHRCHHHGHRPCRHRKQPDAKQPDAKQPDGAKQPGDQKPDQKPDPVEGESAKDSKKPKAVKKYAAAYKHLHGLKIVGLNADIKLGDSKWMPEFNVQAMQVRFKVRKFHHHRGMRRGLGARRAIGGPYAPVPAPAPAPAPGPEKPEKPDTKPDTPAPGVRVGARLPVPPVRSGDAVRRPVRKSGKKDVRRGKRRMVSVVPHGKSGSNLRFAATMRGDADIFYYDVTGVYATPGAGLWGRGSHMLDVMMGTKARDFKFWAGYHRDSEYYDAFFYDTYSNAGYGGFIRWGHGLQYWQLGASTEFSNLELGVQTFMYGRRPSRAGHSMPGKGRVWDFTADVDFTPNVSASVRYSLHAPYRAKSLTHQVYTYVNMLF